MLDKIKQAIFAKYQKTDNKWLFLSAFNQNNELLVSSGVVFSDKELEPLVETIYHWLIEKYKDISSIIIDVVTETETITDIKNIQNISLQDYGLILTAWTKSWVLLPDTAWMTDISSALKAIKQKNWLEWNTTFTKFKTDRFIQS